MRSILQAAAPSALPQRAAFVGMVFDAFRYWGLGVLERSVGGVVRLIPVTMLFRKLCIATRRKGLTVAACIPAGITIAPHTHGRCMYTLRTTRTATPQMASGQPTEFLLVAAVELLPLADLQPNHGGRY